MGNHVEDFYLSLQRKELQALCRKHGLSANKTNSVLARSLILFLKEKDKSSAFWEERCDGPAEAFLSDFQSEEPFNKLAEISKAHKRVQASGVDSYEPSFTREKECNVKRICQVIKKKEINHPKADTSDKLTISSDCMIGMKADKVADTAGKAVFTSSADIETTEGISCSSVTVPNGLQTIAPSCQETVSFSKSLSQHNDHNLECRNIDHQSSLNLRSSDQHVQCSAAKSFVPQYQLPNITIPTCPKESGFAFSIEPRPSSFQFFVRSEDGINLYVDLNSGPSHWIKDLKDEVRMYQKVHDYKSQILHKELKGLGQSGECTKSSFMSYSETAFQNSKFDKSHDSNELRTEKDDQIIESDIQPKSELRIPMGSCNLSCPQCSSPVQQGSPVAALNVGGGHVSFVNDSLSDFTSGMPMNMNLDELNCQKILEFHTKKSESVHSSVNSASDKNFMMSKEVCKDMSLPHEFNHENHSGIGIGSPGNDEMKMQLPIVQAHLHNNEDMLTSPYQSSFPPKIFSKIKDVQSESVGLAGHHLHPDICNGFDNITVGNPNPTLPGEQGQSTVATGEESSEPSKCNSLEATKDKEPCKAELPKRIWTRRQHNIRETQDVIQCPQKDLTSRKNLANEQSLLRRSQRLVSKVGSTGENS